MPRDRDRGAGGAGRPALRSFRDDDFEDFVSMVRDMPRMAHDDGIDIAIGFGQTELASMLSILGVGRFATKESAEARALIGVYFKVGSLRLLCDDDIAGFNHQTDLIAVVRHELFDVSARAVFERSAPTEERPYVPIVRE